MADISSSEYSAKISDSQSTLSKISASVSGELVKAATNATAAKDSSETQTYFGRIFGIEYLI
ncbi:MAG: hypothetical protein ACM65M_09135 [Microcoleus sp.]